MIRASHLFAIGATSALLLGGCAEEQRPPSLPGGGGTHGGGTTSPGPDAAPAPDSAATEGVVTVNGTVCQTGDLRSPTACDMADLGGLSVVLDGTTGGVTTADDGSFTLSIDEGTTAAALVISGVGYRTSVVPVDTSQSTATVVAPIMTDASYAALLTALGVTQAGGTATIAAYLLDSGSPANEMRTIAPGGVTSYYDTTLEPGFNALGPTGDSGAVLMIGIPVAGATTSFIAADAGSSVSVTIEPVPVTSDAITFLWADVSR